MSWRAWTGALVALDALAALLAITVAVVVRFHGGGAQGLEYGVLVALLPVLWVATMGVFDGYDSRFFGAGTEEYRRVVSSGVWLFAGVASVSFLSHADISRAAVGVAVPLVMVLSLVFRLGARRVMQREIRRGKVLSRILVVGAPSQIGHLVAHVNRTPNAGLRVVGCCVDCTTAEIDGPAGPIPVLGAVDDALAAALATRADAIAVAGSSVLAPGALRELSWKLDGTGMRLVVVPGIAEVAGPRIVVRPVNGLPLLHVERPPFTGLRRATKDAIERAAAAVLLVALAPVMLAVAVAVRVTSAGPALFRQVRVGRDGKPFTMLKFRTMRVGAEQELESLEHLNEHDGPLFKIRRDPRLTPVGRWLRRMSLDELPQLINVITGTMSLVGPRPPLAAEVERYGLSDHRRLRVKPGITGLWQVSGRSDLTWDESVRLDLFYIDNWSMRLDLILLWRTVFAVFAGRGAY